NWTIDDQNGDAVTGVMPVYTGAWKQGATCTNCAVSLDHTSVHDGTWHDGTTSPNEVPHAITAQFTGTAVYVFNVVPNKALLVESVSDMIFFLDGQQVGTYQHQPDDTWGYMYNVCVFAKTGLSNGAHTIEIRAGVAESNIILFDYIVYT
ncbi:uncharacterized protein BXZ73DRAFT_26564, partial [Epithele typhae]|uniref:uncharacterized protein n=1 Tax=Epithele typhae TaxID=378194 RepID=UPI0020073EEF